jgi:hypothetical protein
MLFSVRSIAQLDMKFMGDDGIPHNLEFRNADGTFIPTGNTSDIEGSPLFKEQFGFGIVQFKNGIKFIDSTVGFSLFNGRLFFKKANKVYSIDYAVNGFLLKFPKELNEEKVYSFKNGFPPINQNDSLTFYEILYGGASFKLFKLLHKKVQESYRYGIGGNRAYFLNQEYFFFLSKENKMIDLGINPNEKILRKKLPMFSDQIRSYTSTHKLNYKNDDDLILLFSNLNWDALNKQYALSIKNFYHCQNFQILLPPHSGK